MLGRAPLGQNGLHFLEPGPPLSYRQGLPIQGKAVGGDQSTEDRFTESEGCVDDDPVSCAGHGVGGEQEPGYLCGNELLDHDGNGDTVVVKPLVLAVNDSVRRP